MRFWRYQERNLFFRKMLKNQGKKRIAAIKYIKLEIYNSPQSWDGITAHDLNLRLKIKSRDRFSSERLMRNRLTPDPPIFITNKIACNEPIIITNILFYFTIYTSILNKKYQFSFSTKIIWVLQISGGIYIFFLFIICRSRWRRKF